MTLAGKVFRAILPLAKVHQVAVMELMLQVSLRVGLKHQANTLVSVHSIVRSCPFGPHGVVSVRKVKQTLSANPPMNPRPLTQKPKESLMEASPTPRSCVACLTSLIWSRRRAREILRRMW